MIIYALIATSGVTYIHRSEVKCISYKWEEDILKYDILVLHTCIYVQLKIMDDHKKSLVSTLLWI